MPTEAGRIPKRVDLNIYEGDSQTFGFVLTDETTGTPIDTSVGSWAADIKPEGVEEAVESFTVTLDLVVPGRLELFLDAGASQRLGVFEQSLRWDLQQTFDDATVTTHAQGYVLLTHDVTRVEM